MKLGHLHGGKMMHLKQVMSRRIDATAQCPSVLEGDYVESTIASWP